MRLSSLYRSGHFSLRISTQKEDLPNVRPFNPAGQGHQGPAGKAPCPCGNRPGDGSAGRLLGTGSQGVGNPPGANGRDEQGGQTRQGSQGRPGSQAAHSSRAARSARGRARGPGEAHQKGQVDGPAAPLIGAASGCLQPRKETSCQTVL